MQVARRTLPLLLLVAAAFGAVFWTPPIIAFAMSLTAAVFWWFATD